MDEVTASLKMSLSFKLWSDDVNWNICIPIPIVTSLPIHNHPQKPRVDNWVTEQEVTLKTGKFDFLLTQVSAPWSPRMIYKLIINHLTLLLKNYLLYINIKSAYFQGDLSADNLVTSLCTRVFHQYLRNTWQVEVAWLSTGFVFTKKNIHVSVGNKWS